MSGNAWIETVMGKVLWIGGEEPHPGVSVEHPMAKALREAEFWFETPAVGTQIYELGGVVLPGWRS